MQGAVRQRRSESVTGISWFIRRVSGLACTDCENEYTSNVNHLLDWRIFRGKYEVITLLYIRNNLYFRVLRAQGRKSCYFLFLVHTSNNISALLPNWNAISLGDIIHKREVKNENETQK